jgi:hypothetical protein
MLRTLMKAVAKPPATLRRALRRARDDEDGLTTLEVLVITAGLVAIAASAILVFTGVAQHSVGDIQAPATTLVTTG